MAAPEGYKALGKIGISYKGDYNPNTVYERLNAVYHNGSTYLAIKDAPDGAPRNDKINWIYLAKGYDGETVDVAESEIVFTESETRENIGSGEKVSTVFGKIKKFFTDLTAPAFAQMITTKEDLLATKVTGYVPDAKAVADAYTELNGKLIIKDVAVKVLTGYSFTGDAFCENGVTRISGSMSAAAAIKTAEWVKFLQIEDPQFYPTHPSQFPCATHTQGNGAVFAGYINVLTDGGIYVYTRHESIIGSRFFVEFR